MVDTFGTIVGKQVSNQEEMKSRMSPSGGTGLYVLFPSEQVTVEHTLQIFIDSIDSSSFILDDAVRGLPDGTYFFASDEPFNTSVLYAVINDNNTFRDMFFSNTFIDTSVTTGNLVTSSGQLELTDTEIFKSEIIAKNNIAYKTATLNMIGINTSLLDCSVSFDGRVTYTSISLDTPLTITNVSTSGIGIYVSNTSGSTVTLTEYDVKYS